MRAGERAGDHDRRPFSQSSERKVRNTGPIVLSRVLIYSETEYDTEAEAQAALAGAEAAFLASPPAYVDTPSG